MYTDEEFILRNAYAFREPFEISVLNEGENTTFLASKDQTSTILRKYRSDRYALGQIRAEIEWLEALAGPLSVPRVIPNTEGHWVTIVQSSAKEQYYARFDYIDGTPIDAPSDQDYFELGETLALLHETSDAISHHAVPDWNGFERPRYDRQFLVEESLKFLWEAPFLNAQDKIRCEHLATALSDAYDKHSMNENFFIHGDAHMGNVLRTGDNLSLLDFDECGFGHRALDIGVPRLHMISARTVEPYWAALLNGYARKFTEEEIRTGTGLRIFYMAGKIPRRMDIEHLRRQPGERIRRYFEYIENELSGMYPM